MLLVLADLVLVIVVARCGGALAVRIGEPRIAGEMIGAILIGPTLLGGNIEGVVEGVEGAGLVGTLFTPLAVDVLTWVGSIGMVLYMLLVGVTIDPAPMARRAGTIIAVALSLVVAMALVAVGAGALLEADGGWQGPDGTTATFTLALAAMLAVHGVPIAARILEERGLLRSEVGGIVIVTGACATSIALVGSGIAIRGGDGAAVADLAPVVAAGAAVVAIAAPLGRSRFMRLGPLPAVVVLLAIALAAGAAGKALLGTLLLGPLIVGVAVRSAGFSAVFLEARLGTVVRGALVPVFLGVAALHTNLRELGVETLPLVVSVLVAVAVGQDGGGVRERPRRRLRPQRGARDRRAVAVRRRHDDRDLAGRPAGGHRDDADARADDARRPRVDDAGRPAARRLAPARGRPAAGARAAGRARGRAP